MTRVATPDPLLLHADRLMAHPRFDAAVAAYAIGIARLRESPRFVNMIVSADVRWRIVGLLLYLCADRERFGPEGGATYGRLLDLCVRRGEANARSVKSMLAMMQLFGLIRAVPGRVDRRLRFYHPTERMDGFQREWFRYATVALDILEPGMRRGDLIARKDFAEAFAVSGGRAQLADAIPLADRVPAPLSCLKSMLGSYSVILAVLLARIEGTATPSRQAIARRFGLSKSQVNAVMQAGQRKGLFTLGTNADIVATPALMSSFRRWIAIELAFYAQHMPGLPGAEPPPSRLVPD